MAVSDECLAMDKGAWFRYLPVTQKVRSLGAYVLGAGFASVSPHSPYSLHRHPGDRATTTIRRTHPAWRFVYITRGSGVFSSKGHQDEPVQAGDVIVVFPRVWHRYHPLPNTGWKEYWIEFDGDYIRRLMKQTGFSPNTPIHHVGIHDGILDLFLKAIAHLKNEPPEYPLLLGSLATQIIAEVVSAIKRGNDNGNSDATVIREARR
jgi:AraC-like ligand binding domain